MASLFTLVRVSLPLRAPEARGLLAANYPDALQGSQGLWNNNILVCAHFQ